MATPPRHRANDPARLRRWRVSVFSSTWLSYAGYYFCRKPFYNAKGTLSLELDLSAAQLAHVGTGYLATYAVGQFSSAAIGTLLGPRRMVLAGMMISVASNALMGSWAGFAPLMAMMLLNGLAQATGWSGNVGTMAAWTRRAERGTVLGIWSTCYQVGGLLGGVLAAYLVGAHGWRGPFFGGAGVLLIVWLVFLLMQRDRPEHVGLAPLSEEAAVVGEGHRPSKRLHWDGQVVLTIGLMGATYFCVKFVRYLLLSWAAFFLQRSLRLRASTAGYLSLAFDLAGVLGAVSAGVVSDRYFKGRRTAVILAMLLGTTLASIYLWQVGTRSATLFTIGLALIGFMLYGPDSLLSAAGAIDVGGKDGALAAAGIINGIGATGSVLQEQVVGQLYRPDGGLGPIFLSLIIASALSLLCVGLIAWRNRRGKSDL